MILIDLRNNTTREVNPGPNDAEILEHRTPLVSFPTTGAIDGGNFYFIGNTGIANLKDDKIVDPGKLEPVHIAVVPLD